MQPIKAEQIGGYEKLVKIRFYCDCGTHLQHIFYNWKGKKKREETDFAECYKCGRRYYLSIDKLREYLQAEDHLNKSL